MASPGFEWAHRVENAVRMRLGGDLELASGHRVEAAALHKAAHQAAAALHTMPNHPQLSAFLRARVRSERALGHMRQVAELQQQIVTIESRIRGALHPSLAPDLLALAEAYEAVAAPDLALLAVERALQVSRDRPDALVFRDQAERALQRNARSLIGPPAIESPSSP